MLFQSWREVEVVVVEDHRYLDVPQDNRVDWKCNTGAVYKTGHNTVLVEEAWIIEHCSNMLNIF